MAMFNPRTKYDVVHKDYPIRDFHDYREEFVVRPPYQRKNVWPRSKQQALLDSLFRRYYIPRIVVREVRLDDERTVHEVIDGQQRINTVQRFLAEDLTLPQSLEDVDASLPGMKYSDLPSAIRRFVDRDVVYNADIIKGIDNPRDPGHQTIAADIFWRLQQGETLTYMEIAHSRLSSLARNFVVEHADDQRFDYDRYVPIDGNPDKHPFFSVIDRSNQRMQHLALLTRFLILEENLGPANIRDVDVTDYIDKYQRPDGIGSSAMDEMSQAKAVLRYMNAFRDVFGADPMIDSGSGMREFRIEYFIISVYLLLRHLITYYAFGAAEQQLLYDFTIGFHGRWRAAHERDRDILLFSNSRQQTGGAVQVRDMIMRQAFFEYAAERGFQMLTKDERRAFSEAERIAVYRRDGGLCQACLAEGKPEREAQVSWSEYETDHVIPHSLGGHTDIANAQVLCRYHNRSKGARTD